MEKKRNYYWIFAKGLLVLLVFVFIFRLTLIGQGGDAILRLIFGWNKYLIYMLILFFGVIKIFKIKKLENWWKERKTKITKQDLIKISWLIFNICWLFGLIGAIIITSENSQWEVYSNYGIEKLIPNFAEKWKESSVYSYKVKSFEDFFLWHKNFSTAADSGGIIGITIASFSAYLFILGGFTLNLISFFLMISYFWQNNVFYLFLPKRKKEKIKWENMKRKEKDLTKTHILDEAEDQDITIELQTAKKMDIQEKSQLEDANKSFSKEHENFLKNIGIEDIKEEEMVLDSEKKTVKKSKTWKTTEEIKEEIKSFDEDENLE